MKITSLPKNIASYCSFFALALLVGALESVHVQYQARGSIDLMMTLDATIAYVLPSLVLLLGSMKLPSVGHEPLSARAEAHEDRLQVADPPQQQPEDRSADLARRFPDGPPPFPPVSRKA